MDRKGRHFEFVGWRSDLRLGVLHRYAHFFSLEFFAGGEDMRHHGPIPQIRLFLLLPLFVLLG